MTFPHRIEMPSPEQMAAEDPFGGRGVKVQFETRLTREQAADEVTKRYGGAPFISWTTHAWVDGSSLPTEDVEKGSS